MDMLAMRKLNKQGLIIAGLHTVALLNLAIDLIFI